MRRKMFSVLLLTVLFVSMLSCGQPEVTTRDVPLARYMPADTVLFFSLQLRPEGEALKNWQRIRDAFAQVPAIQEQLEKLETDAQAELPFNWKADVDPWLGKNLSIGLVNLDSLWGTVSEGADFDMDMETAVEETAPPPFLLAVEVRDRPALEDFFDIIRTELEREEIVLQSSPYEDTTIYSFSYEGEDFFYALREESVLFVTNERAVLEGALERQEDESLAANTEFLGLLERLPPGGLALGYGDYEAIREGMRGAMSEAQDISLPDAWGAGVRAGGFTLLAEPEGLRVQMVATLDLAAMAEAGLKDFYQEMRTEHPGHILEFMPQETTIAFTGRNLKAVWDMQIGQLEQLDPAGYEDLQGGLDDIAVQTGLDLEEDILSWMTGEYGLFLAPGEEPGVLTDSGIPSFRLGFLFEVADQDKAQQALDKIETLLFEQAELAFSSKEIGGVETRVVPMLEMMGYLPGYAFVDGFLVIAIDKASFLSAFEAKDDKGARLAASSEFSAVMEALPAKHTGLFFLDFVRLTSFLDGAMQEPELADFRKEAKPLLDLLGGLGMAGAAQESEADFMSGTVFLHIAR